VVLPDVNVLVNAFRSDAPHHEQCRKWLLGVVNGNESYAMAPLVLSGFVRVVTHPRVFDPPTAVGAAFELVDAVTSPEQCVLVSPGARHWDIFNELCVAAGARGNLVPDAYLAALAVESGCEWITTDRDFARFKSLRWRHPLG